MDLCERFDDLRTMNFPTWLTQTLLADLPEAEFRYQQELAEIQSDESLKALFKHKGINMWFSDEVGRKYPSISSVAKEMLIPFPSFYLVECGFSTVGYLLDAKRNRLDITQRGDLRLKLTKLSPRIKDLCRLHQGQGSH